MAKQTDYRKIEKAENQENRDHQHGQNDRACGNAQRLLFDGGLHMNQQNRQPFSTYNSTGFPLFVKGDKVGMMMSEKSIH